MTHVGLDRFREVFSSVPSPVSIVSVCDHGEVYATTVSSFCSLSAEPPMVLVALALDSNTLDAISRVGSFAVSILAHDQHEAALSCASKDRSKASAVTWASGQGQPHVEGAVTWMACSLVDAHEGGDHAIVTGLIVDCGTNQALPLVYHRRTFCIPGPSPAAVAPQDDRKERVQ